MLLVFLSKFISWCSSGGIWGALRVSELVVMSKGDVSGRVLMVKVLMVENVSVDGIKVSVRIQESKTN